MDVMFLVTYPGRGSAVEEGRGRHTGQSEGAAEAEPGARGRAPRVRGPADDALQDGCVQSLCSLSTLPLV